MSRMIEVVDYDPVWIAAFEKEAATLNAVSCSFYTSILRHDLKPGHFGFKVFHVVFRHTLDENHKSQIVPLDDE